ncbi:MAG: mechanosensitive ion channel family protein, partial [Phycisphaerales bacterium JB039]
DLQAGLQLDTSDWEGATLTLWNWVKSPDGGVRVGLRIVYFVLILIAFWIIGRIFSRLTRAALGKVKKSSVLLRNFLSGLVFKITMALGIVVAVSMLGVNINPLLAAIGGAIIVVGLALQGTLSNFASGIMILMFRPFDEGDVVEAGGVSGKVESLSLFSTTILTFDNQVKIVPNTSIWGNVITNITGRDTRRVDMTFGISYADDMDKAARILEQTVKAHDKVLADPAPNIKVHQLGDSSVNFIVRPWVRTSDYWDVYWDLTRAVKQRFDAEGVSIPFPQRDVHLFQHAAPAPKGRAGGGSSALDRPVGGLVDDPDDDQPG